MPLSPSQIRELHDVRVGHARIELDVLRLRVRLLRRYDPNQPRVPAGSPEGGRWTDGGGGQPREDYAQLRPRRVPGLRVINGRGHQLTAGQETRLVAAEAEARSLTREVQRRDPDWRPPAAVYSDPEGLIRANQLTAQQARLRLQELGASEPRQRSFQAEMIRDGREIGIRHQRASPRTRTVSDAEFNHLIESFSLRAELTNSPSRYGGSWFQRPDGSIFGLRRSDQSGITLDIIRNDHPVITTGY
ncbi:MAG TPA: hypothetical protein VIL65_04430 [Beijerinckiaceae bacterium]|jgi:hypothetical protein